jgi:branched-chain amino acid aminotransferase
MISNWLKNSDKSMSSKVKAGANYINSRYGQMEAIQKGHDLALFFNHNGSLAESGGSSVGLIKDKILYFPKLTDSVLDSVTRQIILKIAPSLKLKTQIKSLAENEILSADEIFVCGSSAEIQEITHVNNQQIVRDYSDSFISNLHQEYLSFCTNATNYDYIKLLK